MSGLPLPPRGLKLNAARNWAHQILKVTASVWEKRPAGTRRHIDERFDLLAALSQDWVWEKDHNLRFTRLHGSAATPPKMNAIGKRLHELPVRGVAPEDWEAHRNALQRREPFKNFTIQAQVGDAWRWIMLSGAPVFDKVGRFKGYCGVGRDITAQLEDQQRIWNLANTDMLTKLPNRRAFIEGMEITPANEGVVLWINLNNFKSINESRGQWIGDMVLRTVAQRLAIHCCDAQVGHLRADEFVVYLPGSIKPQAARERAAHLSRQLCEPIADCPVISATIGLAHFPEHGCEPADLLRRASQAHSAAKKKNTPIESFVPAMEEQLLHELQIAQELRQALDNDEFELHYQPIVDLANPRHVYKAEALLRWTNPRYTAMGPATFIPIAERAGLIGELGAVAADKAIEQCARWRQSIAPDLQVSINRSPLQVRTDHDQLFIQALQRNNLDGTAAAIELTEGLLLEDEPQTHASLHAMRAAGVNISIDDFGTGYSSLSYLQKFPADFIKIDRVFVQGLQTSERSKSLCSAIIAMAHRLGIRVIAEGVETLQQVQQLQLMGCDFAQGFYFAKPMPPREFEAWFSNNAATAPEKNRLAA